MHVPLCAPAVAASAPHPAQACSQELELDYTDGRHAA
jgi:hypothetical protein